MLTYLDQLARAPLVRAHEDGLGRWHLEVYPRRDDPTLMDRLADLGYLRVGATRLWRRSIRPALSRRGATSELRRLVPVGVVLAVSSPKTGVALLRSLELDTTIDVAFPVRCRDRRWPVDDYHGATVGVAFGLFYGYVRPPHRRPESVRIRERLLELQLERDRLRGAVDWIERHEAWSVLDAASVELDELHSEIDALSVRYEAGVRGELPPQRDVTPPWSTGPPIDAASRP